MNSRIRTVIKSMLVGVGIITLILVAIAVSLHMPPVLEDLGKLAEDAASSALDGKLEIEGMEGSPFGTLRAQRLVLVGPNGERVASARSVEVSANFAALLSREVSVDIYAEGLVVYLERREDGTINLTDLFKQEEDPPSDAPSPVALDISVHADDGVVLWRDRTAPPEDDPLAELEADYEVESLAEASKLVPTPDNIARVAPHSAALREIVLDLRVEMDRDKTTRVGIGRLAGRATAPGYTKSRALSIDDLRLLIEDERTLGSLAAADLEEWIHIRDVRGFTSAADPNDFALQTSTVTVMDDLARRLAPEIGLRSGVEASMWAAGAGESTLVELRATPTSAGGTLQIAGRLSNWLSFGAKTQYDLAVLLEDFEGPKFAAALAPFQRGSLYASIEGSGIDPMTLTAEARIGARDLTIDEYRVSAAYFEIRADDGTFRLRDTAIATPYASAALRGELERSGAFDVALRAESTDAVARVAQRLFGRKVSTRADIELDASGTVDLDAKEPLDILRRLDARARWDVNDFTMEDVRVTDSRGRLSVGVVPTDGARRVSWNVDAGASGVRAGSKTLGSATLDTEGSTRVTSSVDTRRILGALRTTVDFDAQGLTWEGGLVRDAHVLARVGPSNGRLDYEITASVDKVAMGGLKAQAAAATLRGDVKLGPELAWPGAVSALSARGDVSATGVRSGGESAGQITAKIDVSGPISDLGGNVSASATDLNLGKYSFTTLGADVRFTGDRYFEIDAAGRQKDAKPEDIELWLKGRYTRDLTDYTILEFRLKTVGAAWEMDGDIRIDTDRGVFEFEDVTLTRDGQRIEIDGQYRKDRDQDLSVELENVQLGELAEQFGLQAIEPLAGSVSGTATVTGTHAEPDANFRLLFEGLMWEGYGPFKVLIEGSYDEQRLRLANLVVEGYDAKLLEASASIGVDIDAGGGFDLLRNRDVEAQLSVPDVPIRNLSPVAPPIDAYDVRGTVSANLDVRGTLESPVVTGNLGAAEVTSSGSADGTEYEFGPASLAVDLGYLPLHSPSSGLRARAKLAFQDEPPLEASLRIQAPFANWIAESLDGGTVEWAERLERAPIHFAITADEFDLRNLRIGPLQRADVEGLLTVDVQGDGTIYSPRAEVSVDLDDFGWERYRDVYVDVLADVNRDRADFERISLEWDADEILRASGTLPAPFGVVFGDQKLESLPLDFDVQLLPLPLKKFSAVDYTFAALKGQVAGFARLGGTISAPRVGGRFSAVDFEFANKTRGTLAVEFGVADNRANVDLLVCHGPTPVLVGEASAPVQLDLVKWVESEEPVEMFLDGEVVARLKGNNVHLAGLVPRKILDETISGVQGLMDVDLALTGTMEAPVLAGQLQIKNGEMFLSEYARGFRDIQVDLAVSQNGLVQVKRLHVGDVRGYAQAEGTLQLEGLLPGEIDLQAELESFGTGGFSELPAFVTADVDFRGDLSGEFADARARISKLEVVIPETEAADLHATELDEDIVVVRDGPSRSVFEFGPAGDAVQEAETYARLTAVIEPDSWIRHPFAEVEIQGRVDVELRGTGALLGGEIQTVRGSAEVFGRRFVIEEGIVTFTGADPPNPRLQIRAIYEYDPNVAAALPAASSGEPHAIVLVTGRADDPRIRFASDPDMPESDVLYTLITNRAPSQADVGQGGAGNVAAGAASGLAANFLQERLSDVVPVEFDVFRLEAGDEGFADPTLEVGKYIFEDVFFSIEYKVGAEVNENTSEINIEYRFSPRWLLEFEAGNRGTGEANIFWDVY